MYALTVFGETLTRERDFSESVILAGFVSEPTEEQRRSRIMPSASSRSIFFTLHDVFQIDSEKSDFR